MEEHEQAETRSEFGHQLFGDHWRLLVPVRHAHLGAAIVEEQCDGRERVGPRPERRVDQAEPNRLEAGGVKLAQQHLRRLPQLIHLCLRDDAACEHVARQENGRLHHLQHRDESVGYDQWHCDLHDASALVPRLRDWPGAAGHAQRDPDADGERDDD